MRDAPEGHVTFVAPDARVARDASLGPGVVVEAGAEIGAGARLGPNVAVLAGTRVGRGARIEAGAVLGRAPRSSALSTHRVATDQPPTVVGPECMIGANAVLYAGVTLGRGVLVGDLASIREGVAVGDGSIVGRATQVENDTTIGAGVKIQTGCYITGNMVIEDDVFIGPHASTTNDKEMDREKGIEFIGPTIRRGARIGSNCTLLPRITIGVDAVVGAGAVVTTDVPDFAVVAGVPARVRGQVPPHMRVDVVAPGPDG